MADDSTLKLLIQLGVIGKEDAEAARDLLGEIANSTTKSGEATEEAGKKAEHAAISHRDVHKILKLIASEAGPEAGIALNAVWAGAFGGGVGAGLVALRELISLLNEAKAAADELAKAQYEATDAAIEGQRAWKESLAALTESEIGLREVFSEQLRLLKDRQKLVSDFSGKPSGDINDLQGQQDLIGKQISQLVEAISELTAKSKAAEDLPIGATEQRVKDFKADLDKAGVGALNPQGEIDDAKIERLRKRMEAAKEARDLDPEGGGHIAFAEYQRQYDEAVKNRDDYIAAKTNYDAAMESLRKMKEEGNGVAKALADTKAQLNEALARSKSLGGDIVNAATGDALNRVKGGDAMAAFIARAKGQKARPEDAAAADAFVQLEQSTGQSNNTIISLVNAMVNRQISFEKEMDRLLGQIRTGRNRPGG